MARSPEDQRRYEKWRREMLTQDNQCCLVLAGLTGITLLVGLLRVIWWATSC